MFRIFHITTHNKEHAVILHGNRVTQAPGLMAVFHGMTEKEMRDYCAQPYVQWRIYEVKQVHADPGPNEDIQ